MPFETRFTWDKLVLELELLRREDFGSLIPLCIGIHSVLFPKDVAEGGFRHLQFMGFEILKECGELGESERWDFLRDFLFNTKSFQLSAAASTGPAREREVLMKHVIEERRGHPLAIVLLVLHFAHDLDIPIALLRARDHFVLKWVRSGKTIYLDLYRECRALGDAEVIRVLNASTCTLETWGAKDLLGCYLTLLAEAFRESQSLTQLHTIYNLILELDDANTQVLAQRSLLRKQMGFTRDALADLKRYFSFVEQHDAPPELRQAWMELEAAPEPSTRGVLDILH